MKQYLLRLTVIILIVISLASCFSQDEIDSSPSQSSISSLMLDADVYPQGWKRIIYNEEKDTNATIIEHSEIFFEYGSYRNELSMQEILQFSSSRDAEAEFDGKSEQYTNRRTIFVPPEISFIGLNANRTNIQCFSVESEVGLGIIRCNVFAQYETHLLVFSAPVGRQLMSYADFNKILHEIDKKMGAINRA